MVPGTLNWIAEQEFQSSLVYFLMERNETLEGQ